MKQMCYSREWGGGGRNVRQGETKTPRIGALGHNLGAPENAAAQQFYVPHFSLNVFCSCRRVRSRSTESTSLPWLFSTGAPDL